MIILALDTKPLKYAAGQKYMKKVQELKADFTPSRLSADDMFSRLKALKLSGGLSQFKCFKNRGYDFKMVLAILLSMVVSPDKTVNSYLNSPTGEVSSMGKDLFYRLKNSPFICWQMLMWYLVHRFLKVTSKDSDVDDTSSRYLIFDDTMLSKTGKLIKDSYTAKRVEELDTNKIQMVLRMFFTTIYRGLRADYVLVDSWFTCDALKQAMITTSRKGHCIVQRTPIYSVKRSADGYGVVHRVSLLSLRGTRDGCPGFTCKNAGHSKSRNHDQGTVLFGDG